MDQNRAIADLLDREACRTLVHKLARSIDRCDPELLKSLFHDDATDDHGIFVGTAADFVPWVMDVLRGMHRTQHMIGNILIELDGDKAYGESYFIAHHHIPSDSGTQFMVAAGRYLDRFERRQGTWKISHRHAVYDWSTIAPSSDMWDRTGADPKAYGARKPDDMSYTHLPSGKAGS